MKELLTVILTAIVVVATFLWISVFKPEWLVKLQYDKDGFPRIKKRGDRFVLAGQNYTYDGTNWIKVDANWFPLNPIEGDSFVVDGQGYKFTNGVWVKISGPDDTSNERNILGLGGVFYVIINNEIHERDRGGRLIKINCPDYTNNPRQPIPSTITYSSVPVGATPVITGFCLGDLQENQCQKCLIYKGVKYVLTQNTTGVSNRCCYTKI